MIEVKFVICSTFGLCITFGFLLFPVVVSEIPLGSKLSLAENETWVSFNGDFAFGFFNHSNQPNQYSVGIRFNSNSIPVDKRVVVWVARADISVGNMSYFELTENGELVLFDSSEGVITWSSKTSQLSVASAILSGNGNLVLLDRNKEIVWQSFDIPSDTLLPGQNLPVSRTVRAANNNSMSSYYTLYMNASGELQLRWESNVIYWTSGSRSSSNLSAVLTSSGVLQLQDYRLNPVWSIFGDDHSESVNFRFLRLDIDGNLRLYSWIEESKSWRSVWQAVENQCNVFATCGMRGICVFTPSGNTDCKCPFKLTNEPYSKCSLPYQPECKSGSIMHKFEHTYMYGVYPPHDSFNQTTIQECKSSCLSDPLCTAATFMNDGTAQCRVKKTEFVSGYSGPSLSSVSFVKSCSDPLAVDPSFVASIPPPSQVKPSSEVCISCLVGAATGTSVLFLVLQFGIGLWVYRKRKVIWTKVVLAYADPPSKGLIMLSFTEMKDLSGNFKHQIGPRMYKGLLPNNQQVAIKDLEATIAERKFRSAVTKISNIHHKNLVKLEGYCCELGHRYLVYEYAKNGSLEKYIEDSKLCKSLTWRKRIGICISVARAISYLHTGCREFVSHGNLKCENVLLGETLDAKVTEFGLGALHCKTLENQGDPAERDVEDFGRMVLILLTGCQGVQDISEWAYKEWMEGHAEKIVDERIDGGVNIEELERALRISFWCLQPDERMRPSMGEVMKVLEGTLTVDPPPPPFPCQMLP